MCDTIPPPPLRIDELDAYEDPYPERRNRAIPVWITIGMAALTFVAALYFGVLLVLFFDMFSLAAFMLLSFGIRGSPESRQRSGKPDNALLGRFPP